MPRFLSIILTAVALTAFHASSLAAECGGRNHRLHEPEPYKFKTSSWVREEKGGHVYYTCVENLVDRDLWMDWFIPGPRGYIPPFESRTSPRFFIKRKSIDAKGCLQYGNHRTPMREYFIGHELDSEELAREKKEGCKSRPVAKVAVKEADKLVGVFLVSTIFLPSDIKDLRNTMIRFDIEVAIYPETESMAISRVAYAGTPYKEAPKANPTDLFVRPASEVVIKAMVDAGYKEPKFAIQGFQGDWSLKVPIPKKATYGNARFDFFDRNGVFIGSIFAPIPVPGQ